MLSAPRVSTGIPGLDTILHGGFIKGTNILVLGGTGTGKTIFCMQYLHNGAVLYNEPGVLVTFEERPKELRLEAKQFNWDLRALEEKNELVIIDAASSKAGIPSDEEYAIRRELDMNMLAQEIYRAARKVDAQRVVIDSLSAIGIKFEDQTAIRTAVYKVSTLLRELNVTSIMTSEMPYESGQMSRFGVEEYVAQGVIMLYLREEDGELRRSLVAQKLRASSHSLRRYPFEVSSRGITVMPGGGL
jgi:KaiC/GvpD/RAD55 family RecA-like ATPase